MKAIRSCSTARWLLLGTALLAGADRAAAQALTPWSFEQLSQQPLVPFRLFSFDNKDGPAGNVSSRGARLQMVGMQSGFITNPLGIEADDDLAAGSADATPRDADADFMQLNVGTYNPYFDLRLPGDPGGVGYYKLHSQVQLLDAGSTSLCLNVQAYTPAGIQAGGVANGPTSVIPALAGFQNLGYGAALQGYFGQSIQAGSRWSNQANSNFHYGMAVQCAVPGTGASTGSAQGLFLFFEALGRYNVDASHTALWEFVPGVQMRLNGNCWMSLSASHYNFLSCSWKY
jgi:hypothetical protein